MKYKILMQIVGIHRQEDFIKLPGNTMQDFDKINLKFREASLRPWRFVDDDGVVNLFPLDSKSVVRVIAVPEKEEEEFKAPKPLSDEHYDRLIEEETAKREVAEKLSRMDRVEEKPKPRTNDELLAIMVERSNCKHDFKDLRLGYRETKNGKRYQPYCTKGFSDGSHCTYRGRYVGAKKVKEGQYADTPTPWTIEHLLSAKQLMEI
jgi:hypothetical protein